MRASIVLLLIVFSSGSAFAQTAAMDEPLSLRQRFLAVVDSPSCAEIPTLPDTREWRPFDLPTIGVQTLYGAIGAGIFTAFGYGIIQAGGWDELGAGLVVMYLGGSLVGVPLGVLYGGDVMGGEASASAVFGGSALGTAAGIVAFITEKDFRIATAVYIAVAFVGPILGYHLSAGSPSDRIREGSAVPPSRPSLGGAAHSPNPRYLMNAADPTIPRPEIEMTVLALRF